MISQEKITEIVEKIAVNYKPDKIILFGSYAHGIPNESSDLDFLIIKESTLPRHKRGESVYNYFFRTLVPLDILVYTKKEIDAEKDNKYSFLYDALKFGKILYERKG